MPPREGLHKSLFVIANQVFRREAHSNVAGSNPNSFLDHRLMDRYVSPRRELLAAQGNSS